MARLGKANVELETIGFKGGWVKILPATPKLA